MSIFRNITLCIVLLLGVMSQVQANDGTYYTKGNQLVPLQETDISVRREVLTISLMDNGMARVDVQYEFWNPGPAKRLTMGFEADPPYNYDYKFYPDGRHPSISLFTVEMNGRQLEYSNAVCVADTLPLTKVKDLKRYYMWDNNWLYDTANVDPKSAYNDPIDYDAGIRFAYVYYFDADFQPGLNRVHHTYVYRMSTGVGFPYLVDYKLTPAARWAGGKIDDFTLTIRADSTAKHFFVYDSAFAGASFTVGEGMGKLRRSNRFGDSCTEVSLRNGAIRLHTTNFHPATELRIEAVGIDGMSNYANKTFRIGGSYDRSSRVLLCIPHEGQTVVPADPAFRQRVIRNLPFANRGHVFRDKRLREYFEGLWWYMPDPDYKDDTSDFTPVDWECVNYKEN